MAVLLAALLLQAPALDEKRVAELIEKCGSDDIAEREAATRDLFAMGEPAVALIDKAARAAKGETKVRLEKVVSELTIPARWVKDILEGDWNQVYGRFNQALAGKELDKTQSARIISAVLLSDAADPNVKQGMLQMAQQYRVRDIWPALLQLITRDDASYGNYYHYLNNLRPPKEAAEPILKMIPKLQNSSVAYQLLDLVRSLKPDRGPLEECLTEVLESDDSNLRMNVLGWLSQGRFTVSSRTYLKWWRDHPSVRMQIREYLLRASPGDAVDDTLDLLKSTQPEDVALAVEYIGRQRILAGAAALVKLYDEKPELRTLLLSSFRTLRCETELRGWISAGSSRRTAVALAADLGWTSASPEILKAMTDEDPAVRREAASAAGALKLAAAAPKLEETVRDKDGGVRRAALVSFAAIQRAGATPLVLTHLRSEDPDLQSAAVEALPMIDAEQALAALTSDDAMGRPITRHALAVLIVKGGTPMLHRVMARVQGRIHPDELHAQIRLINSVTQR
jgi:hypothetical protein